MTNTQRTCRPPLLLFSITFTMETPVHVASSKTRGSHYCFCCLLHLGGVTCFITIWQLLYRLQPFQRENLMEMQMGKLCMSPYTKERICHNTTVTFRETAVIQWDKKPHVANITDEHWIMHNCNAHKYCYIKQHRVEIESIYFLNLSSCIWRQRQIMHYVIC